jgi:hypothetical protein
MNLGSRSLHRKEILPPTQPHRSLDAMRRRHDRLLLRDRDGEALAALGSATAKDLTTGAGLLTGAEPMGPQAALVMRLIRSLHGTSSGSTGGAIDTRKPLGCQADEPVLVAVRATSSLPEGDHRSGAMSVRRVRRSSRNPSCPVNCGSVRNASRRREAPARASSHVEAAVGKRPRRTVTVEEGQGRTRTGGTCGFPLDSLSFVL